MRKLAREAVIFMLIGMTLGSVGEYVYLCIDQWNVKVKYLENLGVALILAPYGFVAGLGIWLFYRLVRFAVKG
jgi:hypothetical protein